jgi:hypothetical protein
MPGRLQWALRAIGRPPCDQRFVLSTLLLGLGILAETVIWPRFSVDSLAGFLADFLQI